MNWLCVVVNTDVSDALLDITFVYLALLDVSYHLLAKFVKLSSFEFLFINFQSAILLKLALTL